MYALYHKSVFAYFITVANSENLFSQTTTNLNIHFVFQKYSQLLEKKMQKQP